MAWVGGVLIEPGAKGQSRVAAHKTVARDDKSEYVGKRENTLGGVVGKVCTMGKADGTG